MGRVIGIDLGTSNSAAAVMEGGRPVIIPSAEGAGVSSGKAFPSFVAFTKEGGQAGGRARAAAGSHQPGRHHLRGQAQDGHRPQVQGLRQGIQPPADLGVHPPEDQAGRGGLPRGHGGGGGHHLPRLFRRQPAHRDQGRGRDRGPEGAAHHQRAHRGLSCLRPGEGRQGAEDPRLRLRRRHARRHDHGDVEGGRLQGRGHQRRYAAGRHRHGQCLRGLHREGVHAPDRHRSEEGHDGHPARARGRGKGQGGAVQHADHGHQPAVHHGGRHRARSTSP